MSASIVLMASLLPMRRTSEFFNANDTKEQVEQTVASGLFASGALKNLLFLRNSGKNFGQRQRIHIWLNWHDGQNAPLMTLLAYILVGHKDWRRAEISIFAAFPPDQVLEQRARFEAMMEAGRIPIRKENVRFFSVVDGQAYHSLVEGSSAQADSSQFALASSGNSSAWSNRLLSRFQRGSAVISKDKVPCRARPAP